MFSLGQIMANVGTLERADTSKKGQDCPPVNLALNPTASRR